LQASSRLESQSSDGSRTDIESSLLKGRSLSRESSYDGSKLSMLGRKDSSFDGELSRMSSLESQGSSDERKHNLSGMYGMFLKF